MQAYAVDGFGKTGSMRELPSPEPGEGQVRIEVRACGVNPVDVAVVQGYMKDMMEHRFPLIPGIDASGVVDAVGEGVAGHEAGDEVFGAVGKMYFGEGANDVVDYTVEDTAEAVRSRYPDGVDAIVDMVGDKDEVSRLSDRVRPGGRVASCVGAADEQALRPRDLTASNVVTVVTSE